MSFKEELRKVLGGLEAMLLEKNRKYGDSALNPARVFSKADPVEQIKVRIDDKLSRVLRSADDEDEDVTMDLMGYLALLRIAQGAGIPRKKGKALGAKRPLTYPSEDLLAALAQAWDDAVVIQNRPGLLWLAECPWGFETPVKQALACALVKGTKEGSVSVLGLMRDKYPVLHDAVLKRMEIYLENNCKVSAYTRPKEYLDDALFKAGWYMLNTGWPCSLRACADFCLDALEGYMDRRYPTDAEHSQAMVLASFGNPFKKEVKCE